VAVPLAACSNDASAMWLRSSPSMMEAAHSSTSSTPIVRQPISSAPTQPRTDKYIACTCQICSNWELAIAMSPCRPRNPRHHFCRNVGNAECNQRPHRGTGRCAQPRVAAPSVRLCAAVNAVTVATRRLPPGTMSSSARTNSRWSIPARMC
jgi:hypothetical protein